MNSSRLNRRFEKNRDLLEGVLLRRLPAFVLSDAIRSVTEVPVFVFHEITGATLESMLRFLAGNDYETVTADEFVRLRDHIDKRHRRRVMLTFDDGHESLYTVAYPLLRRYRMRAVAYIVPGHVPDGKSPEVSNLWKRTLCTWEQIQEMHECGIVDFQSHSMWHHSVPHSGLVRDFVNCATAFPLLESYVSLSHNGQGMVRRQYGYAYGSPVYQGQARYGNHPAYIEDASVTHACIEAVDRNGGEAFFKLPGWRRVLSKVLREARRQDPGARFESTTERQHAIMNDMMEAKNEIERRLNGKAVRHLAYPWSLGSTLAARSSRDVGCLSNAWVNLVPNYGRLFDSPVQIARLAPEYLWRLPGNGRRPFRTVLRARIMRITEIGTHQR